MERAPGGMLDTTMRLLMRKNSVYIAFIFTGAIIGERVRPILAISCGDFRSIFDLFCFDFMPSFENLISRTESSGRGDRLGF